MCGPPRPLLRDGLNRAPERPYRSQAGAFPARNWGDFGGLLDRLDHVEALGADCVWVRPFDPSPLRDNGYDVADYYAVDDRLEFYFADGEGFDSLFSFVGNSHLVYGVGVKDTWTIHRTVEVLPGPSVTVRWTNFLCNHDEWNLLKLPREALDFGREDFRQGEGEFELHGSGHRGVFVHRFRHSDAVLLAAHNTAAEHRRVVVEFDSPLEATEHVLGPGGYHVQDGGVTLLSEDCEYVWLRGNRSARE
ncbi:MAG: alpha-amylase family glycosyl hydrolase [Haloarculaceae archaeon]